MLLALVAVLAATPPTPPVQRTTLRARLDVGGMLIASWYVPQARVHLENVLQRARGLMTGARELDGLVLAYATPVVGPWLVARDTVDPLDRIMLVASGLLQTMGLGLGAVQLFSDGEAGVVETGPVVVLSPIAGGRLGLSLCVTGF